MPKIKNINDENKCPMKNISSKKQPKLKSHPFKFDMKQILKERKAQDKYWERSAEIDKQMKVVDDLFQKEVNRVIAYENNKFPDLSKSGFVVFDSSKYNNNFKKNVFSNVTKPYLYRFYLMSIEENELEANCHFNNLSNSNWLPMFNDIQNILINWGTDVNTLLYKPLLKCQINDERKIRCHNFELVFRFITKCIQKSNDNHYSVDELLTLAKFAATISFDHHYGQMQNTIKKMFVACIEKAFQDNDNTTVLSFSQELFSNYKENQLLNMVVDLFLPLKGQITKQIYTYLSFKLYKSFIGKANDLNAFPSNINVWFVQDRVNKNYFSQNSKKILKNLIHLLEHVVVILDLYKNEEKLSNMYDFLYANAKPVGLSESSLRLVNILDQWKLHLFRLHVNRKKMFV